MSAPVSVHQFKPAQFWATLSVVILSVAAAFVVMTYVAGSHGKCPGETQTSRPARATCYPAYVNQDGNADTGQAGTGVVGQPTAGS